MRANGTAGHRNAERKIHKWMKWPEDRFIIERSKERLVIQNDKTTSQTTTRKRSEHLEETSPMNSGGTIWVLTTSHSSATKNIRAQHSLYPVPGETINEYEKKRKLLLQQRVERGGYGKPLTILQG